MPAFPLPDEQLSPLAEYIHSLNATAFESRPPGDKAAGESFFFGAGNCATCHTVAGRGGSNGPDLSGIARQLTLPELEQSLTDPSARIATGLWRRRHHTERRQIAARLRPQPGRPRSAAPDPRRRDAPPYRQGLFEGHGRTGIDDARPECDAGSAARPDGMARQPRRRLRRCRSHALFPHHQRANSKPCCIRGPATGPRTTANSMATATARSTRSTPAMPRAFSYSGCIRFSISRSKPRRLWPVA